MGFVKVSGAAEVIYLIQYNQLITELESDTISGYTELPFQVRAIMVATDGRVESNLPVIKVSTVPYLSSKVHWLKTKEVLERVSSIGPGVYTKVDLQGFNLDWTDHTAKMVTISPGYTLNLESKSGIDTYKEDNKKTTQLEDVDEQVKEDRYLKAMRLLQEATEACKEHLKHVNSDDLMADAMRMSILASENVIKHHQSQTTKR